MKYHYNDRQYTTRDGARAAARRLLKKTGGIFEIDGVAYAWNMDNVVVYPENRAWTVFFELNAREDVMAEVEAQERLDMEDEAYFEHLASEDKEEAQDEAPRELTVEQALEIAAQQTEAVDEEFRAVEARHRAEAEQKNEMDKVKDMTSMELSIAASTGKGTLAETIDRMETALRHLKEFQREYKAGDPKEDAFYMAERLRRAANEIHGYLCTSLAMELATTAGSLEQLAKVACRLDMDGE